MHYFAQRWHSSQEWGWKGGNGRVQKCDSSPRLLKEVSRLGVKLELQWPCYTTATAMPDPSHICDLPHSSWQRWILNPLSEARDWSCILMDTSQVRFCWAMTGTPNFWILIRKFIPEIIIKSCPKLSVCSCFTIKNNEKLLCMVLCSR